jgi:hypothetical protein
MKRQSLKNPASVRNPVTVFFFLLLFPPCAAWSAVSPGTTIETMDGTIGTWDSIDWVNGSFTDNATTNHIIGVPDSIRFLPGQLNVNEVYIGGVFHLQMNNVPTDDHLRLDASTFQQDFGSNLEHWGMAVVLFFNQDNWVTLTRIHEFGGGYMSHKRVAGGPEERDHGAVGFGARGQWRMHGIELTSTDVNFYASPLIGPETFSSNNWDQLMSEDLTAMSFSRPPSFTGDVTLIVGKGYYADPDPWNQPWDFVNPKAVGIDATRVFVGGGLIEESFPITDILVEQTLGVEFNSEAGATYRLQCTPDLVSTNYSDTGTIATGTGGTMVMYDPSGPSTSKNYRVVTRVLESGQPGFGKQWVRTHPFGIQAISWVPATFDHAEYFGANLTQLFLHPSNGVPVPAPPPYDVIDWHAEILANQQGRDQFDVLKFIPHNTGWVIGDEPPVSALANLATFYNYVRQGEISNTKLCYTANGPADSQSHIEATADILNPDMMYYDLYPWSIFGGIQDSLAQMMRVRSVAIARDLPYGTWLQAFDGDGMSESRNRVNVFSHLTAGYTHLSYWTYDFRPDTGDALIDVAGNPTPMYTWATGSNAEAANIGKALRFLDSTGVRFVGAGLGGENSPPVGMSNWSAGAGGDNLITSVQVDAGQNPPDTTYKNGLIGHFTDDEGQRYFFLTNLAHGSGASAAAQALNYTMTFDNSVTELLRLNRITGIQEVVPLASNTLNINFRGGTGDLFKYNTGDFPGLP